jgi:MFS family permease
MTTNKLYARIAISTFFFLNGICFASWGARIPTIQESLGLSEAFLGTILLSLPMGSIVSMPLAAWATTRFGSRRALPVAMFLDAASLMLLGIAPSALLLCLSLVAFGLASNLVNVALNTQAVDLENVYKRPLMAGMHGLWSCAGFSGAAVGALMIGANVTPKWHFVSISLFSFFVLIFAGRFLLPDLAQRAVEKGADLTAAPSPRFRLPPPALLKLGLMAFCGMLCEGGMFDWAGVYFKKVVLAEGAYVSAGYIAFMTTMAGTRFIADGFKARFGFYRVLRFNGLGIFFGYMLAVLFPHPITAVIGFLIIGAGVSAVVPLVFSEAGRMKTPSASASIATVSTIGFFGFLSGPPIIGWIAGATSLRVSFALVACVGLCITFLASRKDSTVS